MVVGSDFLFVFNKVCFGDAVCIRLSCAGFYSNLVFDDCVFSDEDLLIRNGVMRLLWKYGVDWRVVLSG